MWHTQLKESIAKKTEISELESILGKKGDEEAESDILGLFFSFFLI